MAVEPPPVDACRACDPVAREYRPGMTLEPGDEATWVCRRDGSLAPPRGRAVPGRDGVPYLCPAAARTSPRPPASSYRP